MVKQASEVNKAELNERQGMVVKAVVDSYVEEKVPVASNKVKEAIQLDISSSTIRNDMHSLEKAGYLAHPHTSSGRVPTDLGYRYFVDHYVIDKLEKSKAKPIDLINDDFENVVLVLSSLTNYTAVLVNNIVNSSKILDAHVSRLHDDVLVLAIFYDDSNIQRVVVNVGDLNLEPDFPIDELNLSIKSLLLNSTSAQVSNIDGYDLNKKFKPILNRILEQFQVDKNNTSDDVQVHVAGFANVAKIADQQEISEQLLSLLEQHMKLAEILKSNVGSKVNVKIGEENAASELVNFSVAFSPFNSSPGVEGVLGVIGPTRMDYAKVLLCLQAVSESMENK
ncbi:MAG: heat-inducible transcriptional repressor HrcA [Acidimicrobiia bacterium]